MLAVAQVLAVGLRVAAGRWSDRGSGARIQPLGSSASRSSMVVVLLVLLSWRRSRCCMPALVVATALSMTWNGLSFTAAAELAGSARSGAAIGFQQTTLSIVGVLAAPAFATLVDVASWRAGFALAALGPLAGWCAPRPATRARAGGLTRRR